MWQPIETAPRDGTVVLLLQGRRVMNGFRKHYKQYDSWHWCVVARPNGDYSSAKGMNFAPTHWIPLPKAPTHE